MSGGSALLEVDFTGAKAGLSAVMDAVVHDHEPCLVQRRGRESMLLVRPDDLARWLDTFRLRISFVFDQGEVTAQVSDLGVLGFGESVDEALEDLASELRAYAQRFFGELSEFYRHTDRAKHYPALLRFALTPADGHVDLLRADIEAEAEERRREALGSSV